MQKKYLALLHKIGFTHKILFKIFEKDNWNFEDFYENLSFSNLEKYKIEKIKIEKILEQKKLIDKDKIFQKLYELDVKIITFFDENYPSNLKNIFNPPFLIYYRWDISGNFLAFVGSRTMTSYWKKLIENFVPQVWKYFWIISGWAYGCDFYSHKVALENWIKTISVFWTWIDIFYPSDHEGIFKEILEKNWTLVSIFPLWEPGNPYNFPIRNEIVAGWSAWVIVVEAKEKSWSLITAKLALDLGKELFTFPADIYKTSSSWTNSLIQKGEAKMVLKAEHILEEFNIKSKNLEQKKKVGFTDAIEEEIYNLLLNEPLNMDQISQKLQIDISTTSLKISFMELSLLIRKADNWKYEII